MSTTSYVGVHVLHSLRSAGGSSPKFEASLRWVPNRGTCEKDSSTLSYPKPKTISCWLLRRSTKLEVCLIYGLESIPAISKKRGWVEREEGREEQWLKDDKIEKKEICLIDGREE